MVLPSDAPQLSDLDLLLSVESRGSVGKAAREQGISQPAASLRLRTLERRLGLRLLERSSSGSKLTHEGAILAKCARNAVDAVEKLLACKATLQGTASGNLRVTGNLSTVEYLIPRWLSRMGSALDGTDVEIRADSTTAICEQVRTGKIDLGFVSGTDVPPDLAEQHIGYDELVVVVGPTHPWRGRSTPLDRHELADSQLVLRERGSGTREFAEELLGTTACRKSWLELPSTTAIKQAIAGGSGAAILSLITVARELHEGRLVRIRVDGLRPTTPVRAVWNRSRGLNDLARTLLDVAAADAGAADLTSVRPSVGTKPPRVESDRGVAEARAGLSTREVTAHSRRRDDGTTAPDLPAPRTARRPVKAG